MATVKVNLGKDSYEIEIERGLLDRVGEKIRSLTKAEKIAVITDDHVEPLYGERIRKVLTEAASTCGSSPFLPVRPART